MLTDMLDGVPGIETPPVDEGDRHTYWKYCLRVDPEVIEGGSPGLGKELSEAGIWCAPQYIQKPAFMCEVFQKQRTFGSSGYPFTLARPEATDYDPGRFPGTYSGLDGILVLPWNEKYTTEHVEFIGDAIKSAVQPPGQVTVMEKQRFAIIGAGAISQGYAQAFQTCDEAEVVAVADVA